MALPTRGRGPWREARPRGEAVRLRRVFIRRLKWMRQPPQKVLVELAMAEDDAGGVAGEGAVDEVAVVVSIAWDATDVALQSFEL